ncbi:hypothetical protein JL475_30660 [Streptomyces sp. M2CJ-2]|uniref:hypothetical protein n=1 Tax=Streptomyces sp. M2CJ-2 TaxID=2803948 RepID=UPI0019258EDB|nr:hypothetical protein [Streptomyces sp. M2CJ-2]MBL3670262.1 hypothetical protein [Streptomyces sp. M2CJ-2]
MTERPGQWPVDQPVDLDAIEAETVGDAPDPDELYVKRAAERGRHEIVLGSIRAHLEEQPTSGAVQAVARKWCADVTALGDEIAKARRKAA